MAESMVERLGEAIWQAEWARAGNSGPRRIPWGDNSDKTREQYCFLARAVLEALKTPTEGMVRAGLLAARDDLEPTHDEMRDFFATMIQAALNEGEGK